MNALKTLIVSSETKVMSEIVRCLSKNRVNVYMLAGSLSYRTLLFGAKS